MDEPRFDVEAVFDEDYLYFYAGPAGRVSAEQTQADVEAVWRLLELEPGLELLDLACGHGRMANSLAERGVRVTGLDATALFLDLARRDAAERGVEVEYVHGDMRSLPWSGRFDRVLNWFTSYGYFDDDDNRRVLSEACRALKPGGRLLIENNNLPVILTTFRHDLVEQRDGNFVIDRSEFDPVTSRVHTERTVIRDGRTRTLRFFVRLFTAPELRRWLLDAGFSSVESYGTDGAPLTMESRRMITVARR